jgi:hypothetical protein
VPYDYQSGPFAASVSDAGAITLSWGGRVVASGSLFAFDAGPAWFGIPAPEYCYSKDLFDGRLAGRVYDFYAPSVTGSLVQFKREWSHLTAEYTLIFEGRDLDVYVKVHNNHPTQPVHYPAVGGLKFAFTRQPVGPMPVWHLSYLTNVRTGAFHPGNLVKCGASYGLDDGWGVGACPLDQDPDCQTLCFWDYDNWSTQDPRTRWLSHVHAHAIPPGGARTLSFTVRIGPPDWEELCAPYRERFRNLYGTGDYARDYRPWAQSVITAEATYISPANPYGLHGGFRRLDIPEQAKSYCDQVIPALKRAGCQGVIVWGQTGENARGEMYRTDFDVIPPALTLGLAYVGKRLHAEGLKLGFCTRPGQTTYRMTWTKDGTATAVGMEDVTVGRFTRLRTLGGDGFYLDSFGNSPNDIRVARAVRKALGAVPLFSEQACDVITAYTGLYTEVDYWTADSWHPTNGWYPRTDLAFQSWCRWLAGDVPTIARQYGINGVMPAGFEACDEFCLRNRMSPLYAEYTLFDGKAADRVKAVQAKYLTAEGQWR